MSTCARCGGTGKHRIVEAGLPVSGVDGETLTTETSLTRACSCIRDLPAIAGNATWWESETLWSRHVPIPIGNEIATIELTGEVPRRPDGRRVLRTQENSYYPAFVKVEGLDGRILLADDAVAFAGALLAAAFAAEGADTFEGDDDAETWCTPGDYGEWAG